MTTDTNGHLTQVIYDDYSGGYEATCSCGWKGGSHYRGELLADLDRRDHLQELLTPEQAVDMLDNIHTAGETDHHLADKILLRTVPSEVRAAYDRVVDRSEFWAYA